MADPLPADVAEVLGALLGGDDPVHLALRDQLPHLRVSGRCACGCGTAYFAVDTAAVGPAPTGPGTQVVGEAAIRAETGEFPGEVLVFAQGGYLSWLEICSWSDDIEATLAMARRTLRR